MWPPTTVCLSPIPKKLCRFQQDGAKQDLKVNLRGFYRRKALGVACAAVPRARQYCPSLSSFRNKTSSLPCDSGKCWSGTFHTPPFTALDLNHKRSSCRFSFQKHAGQVEVSGPRESLGVTVVHSGLSSEVAGSKIYWPNSCYLSLPFRFSSGYQQPWRSSRQQKGWRPPGHQNSDLSWVWKPFRRI